MNALSKKAIIIMPLLLLLIIVSACNGNSPPAHTTPTMRIPDIPQYDVTLLRDVVYGRGGDSDLLLDIYMPKTPIATPMPAVIYIHGGGWAGGDKYPSRVGMLAEANFFCISINYRLSDQAKFPAAVEDCKCAVRWLRANAEEYNINPDRIGVWGGSAGGHLSMMVGCVDESAGLEGSGGWGEYSSRVQAVCSFYGPTDLNRLFMSSQYYDLIGYTLEERPDLYEAASPISYVSTGDPPLLMIHGTSDVIVPYSQSESMQQAYNQAGLEVNLVKVAGGGHGFNPEGDISPSAAEINRMVLDFFTQHLK